MAPGRGPGRAGTRNGEPPASRHGGNEILIVDLKVSDDRGFSRGDANGDGKINIVDGVLLAENIFLSKYVFFDCKDMLDVDDDGRLDVAGPVYLLTYIFLHGPAPAAPFKACDADATPDVLGCNQNNCQ